MLKDCPCPTDMKCYEPHVSPFDPCRPIEQICYATPPSLYIGIQPPGLIQFSANEALQKGTLWPVLKSEYESS